jgi:predicted nucleic acid-binding protein
MSRALYVAEPRGLWLMRPAVVADCSVLAAVMFAEANRKDAIDQLAGRAVHAPTLLPYEIANVAAKKRRAGATQAEIDTALSDFAEQRIELHAAPAEALCTLCAQHGLSAYDAAYLWVAAELKATLATFDRKLAEAAQRHLGAAP